MDKEKSTFRLPDNWVWTTISEIGIIESGGTPSTSNYKFWGGDIPWVTPADLSNYKDIQISKGTRSITKEGLDYSSAKLIPKGSILFSSRAPIGYVAIAKNDIATNQGFKNLIPTKSLNSEYVYFYFKTLKPLAEKVASGTTFLELSANKFSQLPFPLAPFEEQQRIVSKIEELFSELDHAEKGLQKSKQQLEVYKQVMLKRAFEGKLTNNENKSRVLPKSWKWVKIDEICNVVRGGSPRPAGDPKYYGGNIPFLKVKDLTKDTGIYIYTYEFTIKEAGLHKTRQIKPNTLLLSNSGATLGVPKICMINATMNDGIAAFLDLDKRSNLYLYYFWLSKTKELRNINMGAAQPNLNTDIIKNYLVPYCSIEEQQKIVRKIERHFSLCDKLEVKINLNIAQLIALRQSILKKAFSGKLVPQDTADESASRLLERIKKEREEYLENKKMVENVEKRKTKIIMAEEMKTILQLYAFPGGQHGRNRWSACAGMVVNIHRNIHLVLNRPQSALITQRLIHADVMPNFKNCT